MSHSTPVRDLVAVIPAAGSASRVASLPFSKCLYPLPVTDDAVITVQTPLGRVLDGLGGAASVSRALIVTGNRNSDLMQYVTDRSSEWAFPVAYVVTGPTPSVPHSILRAVPFAQNADVVLAYPDIVFEPNDLSSRLIARMHGCDADILLALVPTDRPDKCDTVELDEKNRVVRICVKSNSGLPEAWILAVWNARFTEFLLDFVAAWDQSNAPSTNELQISEVFVAAQRAGLSLFAERFSNARFLDLGTPDALLAASRFLSRDENI